MENREPPRLHVVGVASEPVDVESLFRRYGPYVATIGLRLLGRRDEADDLVQDVFYDIHRRSPTLIHPAAAKSWLAKIAVRKAFRRLRRRRLRAWIGLDDLSDVREPSVGASQEQRVAFIELYRQLERLPAPARIAWTLRHIEGLPLAEVADLCECSLATVKRRITSAAEQLEEHKP